MDSTRCLSVSECADRLGCSYLTAYKLVASGRIGSLPRVRPRERYRFPGVEFDRFVSEGVAA